LEQRVSCFAQISESHTDSFLKLYFEHAQPAGVGYSARQTARRALKLLLDYLFKFIEGSPLFVYSDSALSGLVQGLEAW